MIEYKHHQCIWDIKHFLRGFDNTHADFESAIFQNEDKMRLSHPPDGSTSPKYKLLCFITTKKILQREECTSF